VVSGIGGECRYSEEDELLREVVLKKDQFGGPRGCESEDERRQGPRTEGCGNDLVPHHRRVGKKGGLPGGVVGKGFEQAKKVVLGLGEHLRCEKGHRIEEEGPGACTLLGLGQEGAERGDV
jgi:hypothetical protein